MGSNKELWFDDIFPREHLEGTEKLWKDIYRIADQFFLLVRFNRYPLTSGVKQYKIIVAKRIDKKWCILFEERGMILDLVLRTIRLKMIDYKNKHKEYEVQKSGGDII